MSALQRAVEAPWAMLGEDVERLLTIAERENNPSPEALEAYRAQAARFGERVKIRDNVALIYAQGPMFKGANLMVELSGATSYAILARDLQSALDSPSIDAIMLCIDSPGGEAHGCDELAAAIYAARGVKPIEAYVSGFAASGGYWLASATSKITVSDLGTVGSIGAVLGVVDRRKADERNGVTRVEFVSSQSPGKRPDIQTDEGKARIQKFVDDIGAVFVAAVAKHRGVSVDDVIAKFGAGGMEVGANAVAAGMADKVGQFEAALSALSTRGRNSRFMSSRSKTMSTENPADLNRLTTEARADERVRCSKITGHAAFAAFPKLGSVLIDANVAADTSVQILDAVKAESATQVEAAVAAAKTEEPKDTPETFLKGKEKAGTLGLGAPDSTDKSPPKADHGWGKAMSYRKI